MKDANTRRSTVMAAAAVLSGLLATVPAYSNPSTPKVISGDVQFSGQPGSMVVTSTDGAVINWKDFSISAGEITRFVQNSASSRVLNRVVGAAASQIDGQLLSNGNVFLINPNGIVIGAGAVVDTAGLVASSLGLSDKNFAEGRLEFSGGGQGAVTNRGLIRVTDGGDVVLVAPSIKNAGVISSDGGNLILAAGESVTLSSMDVDHVTFEVSASDNQAVNLGKLISTGGAIGLFASRVASTGTIAATRVSRDSDGSIRLIANDTLRVSGNVVADGNGTAGGSIDMTAREVEVNSAKISATGLGGGSIRIGGDYQGRGDLRTATKVALDALTSVDADANQNGDGGSIIVWSDAATTVDATLTARGGRRGGDGGFVETSSAGKLAFSRPVDVSAQNGNGGTWLLDPEDIIIGESEAGNISTALNNGSNVAIKTADAGTGEGNISVNAAISKTQGPDASLTLDAHNKINVNKPITSTSGSLSVAFVAGGDVTIAAPIVTNGGSISTHISTRSLPDVQGPVSEEAQVQESTDAGPGTDEATTEVGAADAPGINIANESTLADSDELGGEVSANLNEAIEVAGDVLINSNLDTGGGELVLEGNRVEILGDKWGENLMVNTGSGSITVDAADEFALTSIGSSRMFIETGGDFAVSADSMRVTAGTGGGDVFVTVGETFKADIDGLFVMDSRTGATAETRIKARDVELSADTVTLIDPKGPFKGSAIIAENNITIDADRLLISNRNDDPSIESLGGRIRLQNLTECVGCTEHIKGTMNSAADDQGDRDDPFDGTDSNNGPDTNSGGAEENDDETSTPIVVIDAGDSTTNPGSNDPLPDDAISDEDLDIQTLENSEEIVLSLLDPVINEDELTPEEKKARRDARKAKRAAKKEQQAAKSSRGKSTRLQQCQ